MGFILELAKAVKSAAQKTFKDAFFPNLMTREEAIRILGLEQDFRKGDLARNYERMYNINSVKNKGSSYIQDKIRNAYRFLTSS